MFKIHIICIKVKAYRTGKGKMRHLSGCVHLCRNSNIGAVGAKTHSSAGSVGVEITNSLAYRLCNSLGHSAKSSSLFENALDLKRGLHTIRQFHTVSSDIRVNLKICVYLRYFHNKNPFSQKFILQIKTMRKAHQ